MNIFFRFSSIRILRPSGSWRTQTVRESRGSSCPWRAGFQSSGSASIRDFGRSPEILFGYLSSLSRFASPPIRIRGTQDCGFLWEPKRKLVGAPGAAAPPARLTGFQLRAFPANSAPAIWYAGKARGRTTHFGPCRRSSAHDSTTPFILYLPIQAVHPRRTTRCPSGTKRTPTPGYGCLDNQVDL